MNEPVPSTEFFKRVTDDLKRLQEEQGYWRCVIASLQTRITVAEIAEKVQAEDRQVWRWKAGERIPRGLQAIRLYMLHVKLCPERQCPVGHVAEAK